MESSCRIVERRLDRLLDADLPLGEHARLAAHVRGCPSCQALARSERHARLVLAALADATPEPAPEVLDRIELMVAARLAARGVPAG